MMTHFFKYRKNLICILSFVTIYAREIAKQDKGPEKSYAMQYEERYNYKTNSVTQELLFYQYKLPTYTASIGKR